VRCPLCNETSALDAIGTTPYAAIWRDLERELGVACSAEVRATAPAAHTTLTHCRSCDLYFFWPIAPGDTRFYAELSRSAAYYNSDGKWEYGWVLRRIPRHQRLLDVGCGPGHFLLAARDEGHLVSGLETNASVAAGVRDRGIEIAEDTLDQYAAKSPHDFDVVCAFHVLEHVADPLSFARNLIRCARVGGAVVIVVPNANRTWRAACEPLDHPPHHVTRWTAASLVTLVEQCNQSVEAIAFEPCPWATAQHWLEKTIHAKLRTALKVGGNAVGAAAGFVASRTLFPHRGLYDALDVASRAKLTGLSMAVVMRCKK
jgi:SAM-dependent methyltransferase